MRSIAIVFICLTICLFVSCTYEKANEVKPVNPDIIAFCDTSATISYSAQIAPIISSRCISCHTATDQTKLYDYTHVKANALATSGSLYGAITADGTAIPMPPNTARLSSCDITKIKKWIDSGTPDN